jgi:hypothetical protein
MSKIIQVAEYIQPRYDHQIISIEQYYRKIERRRKRVAKRMYKKTPMFAIEFMQKEFPGYTIEQFEEDIAPGKYKPKKKKGKSQLKRQGRYPLMQKALSNYYFTGDVKYLQEAQKWREKMFLKFEVVFRLGKEQRILTFPSTTSVNFIQNLAKITFTSWEELDKILEKKLEYSHLS